MIIILAIQQTFQILRVILQILNIFQMIEMNIYRIEFIKMIYRSKQLFTEETVFKFFKFLYQVESHKWHLSIFVLRLYEFIIFANLITIGTLQNLFTDGQSAFLTFSNKLMGQDSTCFVYLFIYLGLTFLIVGLFIVYFVYHPRKLQINRHIALLNVLTQISSIALFIGQLLFLPFLISVTYIFSVISSVFGFISFLTAPLVIVAGIIHKKERLFDMMAIVICIIQALMSQLIFLGFMACLCAYFLQTGHDKLKKIIYLQLLTYSLLCIFKSFNPNSGNLFFSYFAFITVFTFVNSIFMIEEDVFHSKYEENQYLLQQLIILKKNDEGIKLDKKVEIKIERIFAKYFRSIQKKTCEGRSNRIADYVKTSPMSQMSKNEIAQSLLDKINNEMVDQDTLQMNILLIKTKIHIERNMIQILTLVQGLQNKKISNNNLLQKRYKIFQLSAQLQAKYFLNKSDNSQVTIIIETQHNVELFYHMIQKILTTLIDFWNIAKRDDIQEQELDDKFTAITHYEKQMIQRFQQIQKYKESLKQAILMEIILNEIDDYRTVKSKKKTFFLKSESLQTTQRCTDSNFILVQNSKILKISFEIITELQYDKSEIVGDTKLAILTPEINDYIDEKIEGMKNFDQNGLILPLMTRKGKIILKKCYIFIYPEFSNRIKYLFNFVTPTQDFSYPVILYHAKTDVILASSQNFCKFFRLNPDEASIQKKYAKEIFDVEDLGSEESLRLFRQAKILNAQLNTNKLLAARSSASLRSINAIGQVMIKVCISLIQEYKESNDSSILLLEVKSGHFIKTEESVDRVRMNVDNSSNNGQTAKNTKNFLNQRFFCKIKNPFQSIIIEKQQNFNNKSRHSNVSFLNLSVGFVAATLTTLIILIIYFYVARMSTYNQYLRQSSIISIEYSNLSVLFTYGMIRYHVHTYPESFLSFNPAYNISTIQAEYANLMNASINFNLHAELEVPIAKQKLNLTYAWIYDNFNISENTASIGMIDFLTEAKLTIPTFNISFLLNNYATFRSIQRSFTVYSMIKHNLSEVFNQQTVVFYIFIGIFCLMALIQLYIIYQVEDAISCVYKLIGRISPEMIEDILDRLENFKSKIEYINTNNSTVNSNSSIASMKIFEPQAPSSDQMQFERSYKKLETKKIYNNPQLILKQHRRNGALSAGLLQRASYQEVSSKTTEMKLPTIMLDDKIKRKSILISLGGGALFLFYLGAILMYILLINSALSTEYNDIMSIFTYLEDLQNANKKVIDEINDPYIIACQNDIFGTPLNSTQQNFSVNVSTYFSKTLPPFFDDYLVLQQQMLYSNLCISSQKVNVMLLKDVDCNKIFNGSFVHGFSESFEYYRISTNELRSLSLPEYLYKTGQNRALPIFIEVAYSRKIIMEIIYNLMAMFIDTSQKYTNHLISHSIQSGSFAFLILVFMLSTYWFLGKNVKKRSEIGMKYFCIIPRKLMFDIRTTNFIKNNQIIDKLDRL